MIEIDDSFIDAEAPNASAIKNGRSLSMKQKFVALHKSPDDSLLFGECAGSGKSNYRVSCDFAQPSKPVYRCSCPSRQFPCKHCLGLMYCWVDGKAFSIAEVPDDIAEKRAKIEQRAEKKKADLKKPRRVNKTALKKKIQAQLEGLDLLEKLAHDLVRTGMGNTSAKTARQIEEQAKQLGNAYLPGAQAALRDYTRLFVDDDGRFDADRTATDRESIYSDAFDQLTRLYTLAKRGRGYLQTRLDDPELAPDTDSSIAAWLGHAWQLRELIEAGLVDRNVELAQLAFNSHDDPARREFVDNGIWIHLGNGRIVQTQTFRPYKAAKFIKGEDSFFQIAQIDELCIYPGDINPRVRWEAMQPRPLEPADLQAIRQHGRSEFADVIKDVKRNLKAPLADRRPIYILNFTRVGRVDGQLVVEDQKGERLVGTEIGMAEEPPSCHLLALLDPELHRGQSLVARFHHDLDTRKLQVKPLAIVTETAIVRLTF